MKSVFRRLETDDAGALPTICAGYGLICAMLFLYNGVVWSHYAAFSAKTEVRLQEKMLNKLLSLPLKQVDSRFSGEWITKLNSDIHAAVTMMNGPLNIPHLAAAVISTLASAFLMLRGSPLFLCITWIFIVLQLFANDKIVLKAVPKWKEESQNAMAQNTSAIKPLITDADTVLLYDAEALLMKNYEETSRKLMKSNMKIHVRKTLSDVGMHLFGIAGYLTILLIGCGLIMEGRMVFSDLVYCFQVRGAVIAGMLMFVTSLNNVTANSVCIKRINDVFEE